MNFNNSITYATCVSLFVLAVKSILKILNLIIDKSYEKSELVTIEAMESRNIPEGLTADLWSRRLDYANGTMTDDDVFNLIARGYDPDAVFKLHYLITNGYAGTETRSRKKRHMNDHQLYFLCCKREFEFPCSRNALNSIFPCNDSFIYILCATILAFTSTLFYCLCVPYFKYAELYLCPFIIGPALYSLFHPPEVDPYSTTKGDTMTGLTRTFYLTIICGCWLILKLCKGITINVLDYIIDFEKLFPYICVFNQVLFLGMPFLILIIIGLPVTIITWILEFLSRYMFGLGGSAGFFHSVLQFSRSAIVVLITWGFLFINDEIGILVGVYIGLATFLLQIPLNYPEKLRNSYIAYFAGIISLSIFSLIFGYVGYRENIKIILLVSFVVVLVFDVVWPYTVSNHSYVIFHFRIFGRTSIIINAIRLFTASAFAPLILSSLIKIHHMDCLFESIVIVSTLNRAFTEPAVFCLGLFIQRFLFTYDYFFSPSLLTLFVSMMIARKMCNIIPILDFWRRSRPLVLAIDTDVLEPFDYLIAKVIFNIFGPDRTLQAPALIWSLITGAPFVSPNLFLFLLFMSSPRPNSFWDMNDGQSIDIIHLFNTRLTEHPEETPVYISTSRALQNSLSDLVHSGRLGIVDSNDIFLFKSESLSAFVHIIAIEPHAVRFQLRGLEYVNETVCHRGEISNLHRSIVTYDSFPNFNLCLTFKISNWEIRALKVPLEQYSLTEISLNRVFLGITTQQIEKWLALSYIYILSQNPNISDQLMNFDIHGSRKIKSLEFASSTLNYFIDPINAEKISYLFDAFLSTIRKRDKSLDSNNLPLLFDNKFNVVDNFPDINGYMVKNILGKTVQLAVVVLSMVSASVAPDLIERHKISDFLDEVSEDYVSAPITSDEFADAFREEKKNLITIFQNDEKHAFLRFVLTQDKWDIFSIQRESVRCFWASEANLQLFIGDDRNERNSIQMEEHFLHNLIVQSCDLPIGYPAVVSPILTSYSVPPSTQMF